MKKPDKSKTYITKNLNKDQFKLFLDYVVDEDGNWEVDEIETFKENKYDIAFEGTCWVDNYEESEFRVCATELFNKITRFEYITNEGRQIVEYGEFVFQLQDDNRTLKVFKI